MIKMLFFLFSPENNKSISSIDAVKASSSTSQVAAEKWINNYLEECVPSKSATINIQHINGALLIIIKL